MAVASGGTGHIINMVLRHLGIRDLFQAVVTSEDVINQKPAPDIFLEAARRINVEPQYCRGYEDTDLGMKAIRAADIITVGPGSLYTSILPNLLVSHVAKVIGLTSATKIFVNNLMTQPGETDGYSAREHLETIKKYAPEIHFDFVVVNDRRSADNGEMVIALVHGNSATVKKLYRERDGRVRLQPANETMAPIFVHENDIAIQGVVVGVIRKY